MDDTKSVLSPPNTQAPCPKCQAPAGARCRSLTSGKTTDTHAARVDASARVRRLEERGVVSDWSRPAPVSDVELAFPARALEIMPTYQECQAGLEALPAEERETWTGFQRRWFSRGLPPTLQVGLKEGIDGNAAFRHLQVIQGSFAPKHEHKEAAVAYLASRWFHGVDWGDET